MIPIITTTILISTTTSSEVDLEGAQARAILFPAAFTGATISFEIPDGAAGFAALSGVTITPVVDNWVQLTEAVAYAIGSKFRIVSASSEAAERTLRILR